MIEFKNNSKLHIHLSFTDNHTIEEITEEVNRYVTENKHILTTDLTSTPKVIRKFNLIKAKLF